MPDDYVNFHAIWKSQLSATTFTAKRGRSEEVPSIFLASRKRGKRRGLYGGRLRETTGYKHKNVPRCSIPIYTCMFSMYVNKRSVS